MKKIILMPFVALCVCSCADDSQPVVNEVESVPVTFSCQGFEIDTRPMTRGELTADGKAMTDIWILDYIGDDLTQHLHQVSTDADFGTPTMNLSVGHHNIYFVASRSTSPTLDTDEPCTPFVGVPERAFLEHVYDFPRCRLFPVCFKIQYILACCHKSLIFFL